MTTAPKVLQDALKIVRALHINYVWDDALCIDQSSKDDWPVESAKMGDIYLEGYLNISAAAATSGRQGLFHNTDTLERLVVDIQHQGRSRHVLLTDGIPWRSWEAHIENSRLNGRGWVLQERLLSPRILPIGRGEVFWECNSIRTGETVPKLPSTSKFNWVFHGHLSHSRAGEEESTPILSREYGYRQWLTLATNYSRKRLTKASDKIVAVTGLADRFAKHLKRPMSSFVAGL